MMVSSYSSSGARYLRAVAVWFGILVLASVNGAIRDLGLTPFLGDTVARALSTVVLSELVLFAAWATIGWIAPRDRRQALRIGLLWLVLTLAFEFLVGHYGFGRPWAELLADYDVSRGRIWILVLFVTLGAPVWAAGRRAPPGDSDSR